MPGIAGIIRREAYEGIEQDLNLMVKSMRHESDYAADQYVNAELGLYLGWVSHPCSLGHWMPVISADKRYVLIIVGEHFEHINRPASRNGNENLDSRTQDLLRLLEESGDKCLDRLNGWFCGVAIDLKLRRVTLFNDRYGMSRVYVHEGKEEFLFASEAKSLLRVRPALRAIDPEGLAQYLRFNCVMGGMTLFKGISLLPAGASWVFAGGAVPRRESYFNFREWEERPNLEGKEFYEKFEETVTTVFPAYMEGPQPVALSLSAGLDTRAILVAAMVRKQRLPCYTFGGTWGETFDIRTARKLAAMCDLPFEAIKLNDQFLREFPSLAQQSVYMSDATLDACGAHDVYFNRIVRKFAPIRLTGKFGSEVVRTRRLIRSGDFPRAILQSWFVSFLDEARTFDHITKARHPLTRVVTEELPWYEYGKVVVEQAELLLRTPYMDNRLIELMYQAPPEVRASRELQARYVYQNGGQLARLSTDLGVIGSGTGNQILSKLTYIPLWMLFKAEFTYLYAAPHWVTWADRKLERLRPERILAGRQKYEGYRIWFKTHFADFIRDTLLSPRARFTEFFDPGSVTRIVTGHTGGTRNYLNEINKMLTVELIYSSLLAP
jgi:asparagine synthase (glutamine-hydrolysing)